MNEQPKKRVNPFDKPKFIEEPVKDDVGETLEYYEEENKPQPTREEPQMSYQYAQPVQKTVRRQQRQQYIQPVETAKDKYTATMDVVLRRKIKIYCATNGKMFSEFIEEACREKLNREGVK